MEIIVNGEKETISEGLNLNQLLLQNKVETPSMVTVQINGEFVENDKYESVSFSENDEVEFLYFVGGG